MSKLSRVSSGTTWGGEMDVPQLSNLVRVVYGDVARWQGPIPQRGDVTEDGWYVARVDEEDDRIAVITIHGSLIGISEEEQ